MRALATKLAAVLGVSCHEEDNMARRRHQTKGHLREECGSWLLTYRAYIAGQDKPKRPTVNIGPSTGPGAFTKRQAERIAWDHYLKPLDERVQRPMSTTSFDEYWEKVFAPSLELKRTSTRNQYASLYKLWIQPVIGSERLSDITPDCVEGIAARAVVAGKSTWTAKHIRKVIGAVWAKARKSRIVHGENPAWESEPIKVREIRPRTSLTAIQFRALSELLPGAEKLWSQPYREMAYVAAITSMNAAELCGLRWEAVNFGDEHVVVDGFMIPPRSLGVLWHWKYGKYTSLKTDNRQRAIPMPEELCAVLAGLKALSECTRPHHPVFCSREATPCDADNIRERYLQPAAAALGLGRVGWHSFRRTNATMTDAAGMSLHDRMKILGHGSVGMTNHYSSADLERARAGLGQVARGLERKERVN